jgi:hypothetical protein
MAKAHLTTRAGTRVVVEGDPAEIAALVNQIDGETVSSKTSRAEVSGGKQRRRSKTTPINLLSTLIDSGFFKKPKDLAAVKVALEEMGHHYPITTLSPALLRLVRKRQLRRLRDKNRWLYTGVT